MFRKINTRTLLVIFLLLALLAVIVVIYDNRHGERTFKKELFTVDSSAVTAITLYPKDKKGESLKLGKAGNGWEIVTKGKRVPADSAIIRNILHTLAHLNPERVAGTDNSCWKTFEITDSASTRVVVEQGGKVTADFRIGKLSFSQDRDMQGYGGRGNMSVKSHVRVAGDDRVYVIDGFLSMMFPGDPSQYRNRLLFKIDKNLLTKFTFTYPGDSSFVLSRSGTGWSVNGQAADSAATVKYLNSIVNTMGSEFADEGTIFPVYRYTLKIEGNNMTPVEVNGAFDESAKKYYLRSNVNRQAIFGSSAPNLFSQVFASKNSFAR